METATEKQAKGQTAFIVISPDLVQHFTPFGDLRKKMWYSLYIALGDLPRKKLAVFESVSPQSGYQGCVSYNLLFSTFSLKERLPNSSRSFPWILSHTPDSYHPCLLWHVVGFSPEPWVDHSAQQREGSDGDGCCPSTFQWNLHWIVLRCDAVDMLDYFHRIWIGSF